MSTQHTTRKLAKLATPTDRHQAEIAREREGGDIGHAAQQRVLDICRGKRCSQIAHQTGYHPETVRRYLSGSARMPYDFVVRLAIKQCINPRWLMTGKGSSAWNDPRSQALGDVSLAELLGEIATRLDTREAHLAVSAVLSDDSPSAASGIDAVAPKATPPRLSTYGPTASGLVTAENKPLRATPLTEPKAEPRGRRTATARLLFERAG